MFGEIPICIGILVLLYELGIGQFKHDKLDSAYILLTSVGFIILGSIISNG